ncbi:hypothetical protein [Caloranaerobacter sp. DY30410]|uniref:hypothetical protein n=1 Tax=Caloranaerobacter sp. DY30410 TaxID=3238305 RepID=UPI003D067887
MTAKSYVRGHLCEWNGTEWVYSDTKESIKNERPCARCGKMPTTEGYDQCLGYIEGAVSACCGHGVEEGFILYEDGNCKRIGDENVQFRRD